MDITYSLARFFGLFFTVIGIWVLKNRHDLSALTQELKNSRVAQLFAGILPLILGSFILSVHQIWSSDLTTLLSILGWVFLLMGMFRLLMTQTWLSLVSTLCNQRLSLICGGLVTILGIYLLLQTLN